MMGKRRTISRVSVKSPILKIDGMNENQARFIALLIDAEGTICPFKRTDYFHPHIDVKMVSVLPLLLGKIWGGRVDKGCSKRTNRRMYAWTVAKDSMIEELLKKIEPFLVVKKEQAKLALNMLNILKEKKGGWKEDTNKLAAQISKLNKTKEPPDFDTIQINHLTLEGLLAQLDKNDIDVERFLEFWR